jgi:hypothetical protein
MIAQRELRFDASLGNQPEARYESSPPALAV